jgi:uncharacterized LabA/DUF88 family protein
MTTNVYVDGPGLYYGALKDRPGRWLDLQTWCERLLPEHDIVRVRYFTAWANPAFDQGPAIRQRVYLRALQTSPKVSIHFGRCIKQGVDLPESRRPHERRRVIKVRIKGVDVALTTELLVDLIDRDMDTAVLVTTDSDLRPPIAAVRRRGVRVGVVNPWQSQRLGHSLHEYADFFVRPPASSYVEAMFPLGMRDDKGTFRAPSSWVRR